MPLDPPPQGVLERDLKFLERGRDPTFRTPTPAEIDAATPAGFRQVWEPILKQGPMEIHLFGDFNKDTALAATIQVPELFRQAQLITARTFEVFTMYLAAALIYWILATVLSHFQNKLEERVNRHDQES